MLAVFHLTFYPLHFPKIWENQHQNLRRSPPLRFLTSSKLVNKLIVWYSKEAKNSTKYHSMLLYWTDVDKDEKTT